MNKKITKNIFIIFILLLPSCSYEPIFSNKDYGFSLNEIKFVGDKEVNRNIKNRLSFIKKKMNQTDESFDLSIETVKEKKIISKDSRGDPLKFELIILTDLEVFDNNKLILNREIEKSYIYNNVSDKFKLEEDERIISENLSEKTSETIISLILNLNDN